MNTEKPEMSALTLIFFMIWILLALIGIPLFHSNRDVKFKKKYFRWYVVSAGGLFFVFMILNGLPLGALLFFGSGLAIITYLNIRNTIFCESCGRTIYNHMWFSKIEYCAKCGAKIEQDKVVK